MMDMIGRRNMRVIFYPNWLPERFIPLWKTLRLPVRVVEHDVDVTAVEVRTVNGHLVYTVTMRGVQ